MPKHQADVAAENAVGSVHDDNDVAIPVIFEFYIHLYSP